MKIYWDSLQLENEVVQTMKQHTDSHHIFHLKNEGTGMLWNYAKTKEIITFMHIFQIKKYFRIFR